jgi:hypothetical protein
VPQHVGLLMVLALPAATVTKLVAHLLLQRLQQPQQHWQQQNWRGMQRAMLLLLQLSRARLWLLCGSHWWHEQVRMLAACKRLHLQNL